MEIIDHISKWFASQCDGDWEHESCIKINTIDNPGWSISIDIRNTSLEGLEVSHEKSTSDLDWFKASSNGLVFSAFCGVENLTDVLNFFMSDVATRGNSDFFYDIYHQIHDQGVKIWRPYKATLLEDNSFEIKEAPDFSPKDFKFESFDNIDKVDLSKVKDEPKLNAGDVVECQLMNLADYPANVITKVINH
ncbi:MAG: Imm53 family immunity protein [Bacteroidota bacterium]